MNSRLRKTVLLMLGSAALALGAQAMAAPAPADPIHVDIPVPLKHADVVFNMDHRAFVGDLPVGMNYMHLLSMRYHKDHITGKIIGVDGWRGGGRLGGHGLRAQREGGAAQQGLQGMAKLVVHGRSRLDASGKKGAAPAAPRRMPSRHALPDVRS